MNRSITAFLILTIILIGTICVAQKKIETFGAAKGVVRDTVNNYFLRSATVSVYKVNKQDSSLVSYQITNNNGEFNFNNLPLSVPLILQVSNVGYEPLTKRFMIPSDSKYINLNTLVLNDYRTSLREVSITIPPISMNGDTLEFNAAAFKLDTNAVVEDLLRKIPNITLWGDGKITVNGRDVKSLLVNGKEFFGGDFKIATQNIPKNAVEKIQVYKTATSQTNPLDSTIEMNVKLKKGKEIGYFGKVGAGYGTENRYEADASISAFSPKLQFAVVGAFNNINKLANSVRTLTSNSTFKGVGTNIDYRPDFSLSGINHSKALGASLTYNFIEKPTYFSKSKLSLNYFMVDRDNDNSSNSETTTITNNVGEIFDINNSKRISSTIDHKFDSKFEWIKKNHSLIINQSVITNSNSSINESLRSSRDEKKALTSTNNSVNASSASKKGLDFSVYYQMGENSTKYFQKFKGFSASYILGIDDTNSDRLNQTDFKSFTNPATNRKFNRKYLTKSNNIDQQLNVELNKLKELLFGKLGLAGFDFSMSNNLKLTRRNNNNLIEDFDALSFIYEKNAYLTNEVQTTILDEMPGFSLIKSIAQNLSNRYTRNWSFSLAAKQKFIIQDNQSTKSFQNIKRTYSRFVPDANISYDDNQYGEYYRRYSVNYSATIKIPSLQQLAPLVDSTNLYNLQVGNVALKESLSKNISISFNHEDQTRKNTLNYSLSINVGLINNNIVDSVILSNDNRRTTYFTNSRVDNNYLNINLSIRKALKLKNSELQIGVNNTTGTSKNSTYLNSVFSYSNNLNTNTTLKLNYTYRDYLAFEALQAYSTFRLKQYAFNTEYNGANMSTTLSSSYRITKKLSVNSNITFNGSTSTNIDAIKFTIWNASAICRFLKGNNLELKLSALDLLRQNNSIINYGSSNSFTIGTQNVLQHYFMTTISYYPRQFGKKDQKK